MAKSIKIWYEDSRMFGMKGISKYVRDHVDMFVAFLEAAIDLRHDITLYVYDAEFVEVGASGDDNVHGFGMRSIARFHKLTLDRKLIPRIDVAGRLLAYKRYCNRRTDYSAMIEMLATIGHEIAHYEQIRDRRPFNEVGTVARGKALVEQYLGMRKRRVRIKPLKPK